MTRPGVRLSRVVGVALGALLFEAIRRRLHADTWDYGQLDAVSGDRADRTVVAVPFSGEDLRAVSGSAEAAGMSVSQFIHQAALAHAQARQTAPPSTLQARDAGWSSGSSSGS